MRPGDGQEGLRVLGVDATLDRVAAETDLFLGDGNRQAAGDAQLFADDIDAGDHLRDRVLDLHPRVHLDEVETAIFVEELEGAGAAVADLFAGATQAS
jgi:hypothetical protein